MSQSRETEDQLIVFLTNLLQQVDHHVARAVADIDQTSVVLDEAIIKLDRNLNDIHSSVKDQGNSENARGSLDSINNVIVALQFHDLTTQLLQRSLMRLEGMRNILSTVAEIKNVAFGKQHPDDFLMHLREADDTLVHLSDKLHKSFNQSLEQRHMECGDVELF